MLITSEEGFKTNGFQMLDKIYVSVYISVFGSVVESNG